MDLFETFDAYWLWIAIGLVLGALEILVPGVYLIWVAVAAIITGLATFAFDLSVAIQIVIFVLLSLVIVFGTRRFLTNSPIESSDPLLNQRGSRLIGDSAVVTEPIIGGSGRVKHGDSVWIAKGDDVVAGKRVRIIGSEGSTLLVEPFRSERGDSA